MTRAHGFGCGVYSRRNEPSFPSVRCGVRRDPTSCSTDLSIGGQDPADASVELIETELADVIGLGPIDATCESPESDEVGTTWGCTGIVEDGTIEFDVEIDREDHINVETSNLISAAQVQAIAQEASSAVNGAIGSSLGPDAFDCGDQSVILDDSNEFLCSVDTGSETIETTVTITNMDDTSFDVDLAPFEAIRVTNTLNAGAAAIIEGELADLIGLGPLTAVCDEPPADVLGATWACTAAVGDGTAQFVASLDENDTINVNATNVVLADQVQGYAVAAMRQLNETVGASLPDEAMDCGTASIVLPASNDFVCSLDAGDGIIEATITITDLDTGAFSVQVADAPSS